MPGVLARLHGRATSPRYGTFPNGIAVQEPRRLADGEAGAARAGDRQGALRRRPGRLRGRRDAAQARDAAEAVELDIEELPAVVTHARGRRAPGAPQLYDDVPGNLRPRLPLRRRRRRSRRPSPRPRTSRGSRSSTTASSSTRWSRARPSASYDATGRFTLQRRLPGRVRHAQRAGRRVLKVEPRQGARADRQCRRLVRHEGAALPGIRLPAARRARARPAGEVDRRALGELPVRPSRPRHRGARPSWRSTRTAASSPCASRGTANLGAYLTPVAPLFVDASTSPRT